MSEAPPIKKIKDETFLQDDVNLDYAFALALQTQYRNEDNINSNLKKEVDETKFVPYENSFYKKNFDHGNEDGYDPNEILDYYEQGDHFNEYFGENGYLKYPGYGFNRLPQLADEPTHGTSAPLNYVEPPNLPPLGPTSSLNHMYQHPHTKLPASSTVVSENSSHYHPSVGQRFPFKEEQQLPPYHFQEESKLEKLPSTLTTNASQPFQSLSTLSQSLSALSQSVSRVSTSQVVSGLPATAPLSISTAGLNINNVPQTSQASLPTSVIASRVDLLSPLVTQAASSTVTSSHSQLNNSFQRPSVIKTTAFGAVSDQAFPFEEEQKLAQFLPTEASRVRKLPPPYSTNLPTYSGNVPQMSALQVSSGVAAAASTSISKPSIKINSDTPALQALFSTAFTTPAINSLPLITQATLSALLPATTASHSQSKASLQARSPSPVYRTNVCESAQLVVKTEKKKNHNCLSCPKSYIGRAGLARHYRSYPGHGSLAESDKLNAQEKPQQTATKAPPRGRKRIDEKTKKLKTGMPEAEAVELEKETHYNNLLALTDVDLVKNVEKFDCSICLSEIGAGEGIILQECLHNFCRECLASTIQFSETPLVGCPFQNNEYKCESHLQEREVKALVTPEVYEKHLQRSLAIAENQARNSFHCKTPDCPGWCLFEDDVNVFVCPVCNHTNCLTCSAIHEGKNCRQYQEDVELDSSKDARKTKKCLQKLLDDGKAMRCPTCQVVIVKKGGCDMMKCSMCGVGFRWIGKDPLELQLPSFYLQNANAPRIFTTPLNINISQINFKKLPGFAPGVPHLPKSQVASNLPVADPFSPFKNLWPEQKNVHDLQMALSRRLNTALTQAKTSATTPAVTVSFSQLDNPLQIPQTRTVNILYRNGANFTATTANAENIGEPKERDIHRPYRGAPIVTIYDTDDESKEMDVSEIKEIPQQITTKPSFIINIDKENGEKQHKSNDGLHEAEVTEMHVETDYDRLLALTGVDLVQNVEKFECPICFSDIDVGEGVTLQECLHSFCRECLAGAVKFSETPVVKCPFQNDEYKCESYLQEREVKSLVTPDLYEKYLQRSMVLAENQAQNSFHCKTPDCHGWCFFEDDVNIFVCPVCKHSNCLTCSAIHEGRNCAQYQEDVELDSSEDAKKTKKYLQKELDTGKAMRCPKCRVILMKKEGCDWLMCTMCRTEICWVTRGPRWGPKGLGDYSGGCKCKVNGRRCHPKCGNCH